MKTRVLWRSHVKSCTALEHMALFSSIIFTNCSMTVRTRRPRFSNLPAVRRKRVCQWLGYYHDMFVTWIDR